MGRWGIPRRYHELAATSPVTLIRYAADMVKHHTFSHISPLQMAISLASAFSAASQLAAGSPLHVFRFCQNINDVYFAGCFLIYNVVGLTFASSL